MRSSEARYYTPPSLAEFLVGLLPKEPCGEAADICCGSWNLLMAVKKRWPSARLTGVDLDPAAGAHSPQDAAFVLGDGRAFAAEQHGNRHFDLVLANPPFGRVTSQYFSGNISVPGFSPRGQASVRAEAEMIMANSLLVRPGGYLLAILPITVARGESYDWLRLGLARQFSLRVLISLPEDTFGAAQISCFAVVLQRRIPGIRGRAPETAQLMTVTKADNDWIIKGCRSIPSPLREEAPWTPQPHSTSDAVASVDTKRGCVSSYQFSSAGAPVLHTSAYVEGSAEWKPGVRMADIPEASLDLPKAKDGDVLVARVGRSAGCFTIHSGSPTLLSDCMISVRASDQEKIVEVLRRHSDGCRLRFLVKGVTAKYVTERDLKEWLSSSI